MATSRKSAEKTKVDLVRLDSVSMDEDDEILPDFEAEVRVRHLASKEAARRGREAARQLRLQEQQSSAA
ncbi:MAG: hypothetical protein E6I96_09510 [Chloroflexi bacterium]|nr:MAG: hypothetical protein E6I96_09510 [Chloroflexota bacterium]